MTCCPKLKIYRPIIETITVFVVDGLSFRKRPTKHFGHHGAVLVNLRLAASLRQNTITVPINMTLRRAIVSSQICAFMRAKSNSPIDPARMPALHYPAARNFRVTVLAVECRQLIIGDSAHQRFLMNSEITACAVSRLALTGSMPNFAISGNSQVEPCETGMFCGLGSAGGRVAAYSVAPSS